MPKLKTRKAAAKRMRLKPSGKIKHDHSNHEHIATKKPKNRKNRLKKGGYLSKAEMKNVKRALPYG
jgi:large subunit ribosomal protein L35